MKRFKTVVKVEEKAVDTVQITMDEFCKLAADECTELAKELMSTGEPSDADILLPLACARYAAHLCARIFSDEESEEN